MKKHSNGGLRQFERLKDHLLGYHEVNDPLPKYVHTCTHTHTRTTPCQHLHQSVFKDRQRNESDGDVRSLNSILYTIQRHYAHWQSTKSAEALQPWPLAQELKGRGKGYLHWEFGFLDGPDGAWGHTLRKEQKKREGEMGIRTTLAPEIQTHTHTHKHTLFRFD